MAIKGFKVHNIKPYIKFIRCLKAIAKKDIGFEKMLLPFDDSSTRRINSYHDFVLYSVLNKKLMDKKKILFCIDEAVFYNMECFIEYIRDLKLLSPLLATDEGFRIHLDIYEGFYNFEIIEDIWHDSFLPEGEEIQLIDCEDTTFNDINYEYKENYKDTIEACLLNDIGLYAIFLNAPVYIEFAKMCEAANIDPYMQIGRYVNGFNFNLNDTNFETSYIELLVPSEEEEIAKNAFLMLLYTDLYCMTIRSLVELLKLQKYVQQVVNKEIDLQKSY